MLSFGGFFFIMASSMGWASFPSTLSGIEVVTGNNVIKDVSQAKLGTVVVFLSAKCPCSASHEPALKQLFQEYADKGFQFLAVHSNRDESFESTSAHFKTSSLPFPVIQDQENRIANAFNALKTPHAFILGKKGELLFRGGVDDSQISAMARKHYLKDALAALAEGKEPPLKESRTLGCIIQR